MNQKAGFSDLAAKVRGWGVIFRKLGDFVEKKPAISQ
jgi:hypothetical protein